ncbi:pyruvate, phosphate dikinase [Candidatus Aerophobetes bacterium]|uniref:Pyruvate, phosphate dikinase n=1 Tax=Aerophobetes bacterium TaxID=2030807 RepID=A0A523UYT4_UNCAE|nr:MAG: pyruvate, phosphate dikinase [Candidatus Aerophobetes bacterium]
MVEPKEKRGVFIYFFAQNHAHGSRAMRNLLGGKGANLAEMARLGIRVPPGFTITTQICSYYAKHRSYPESFSSEITQNLERLKRVTGKKFGDPDNPLLVSVRSGARISMPGMMDTVLNLGLNDTTVQGLVRQTEDERFAYDAYRRLLQMFGNVVLGIEGKKFEELIQKEKAAKGVKGDMELTAEDFKDLVERFKELIVKEKGAGFPRDPLQQLDMAKDAVFASWNNKRAISYRRIHKIPEHWGTAVNVQSMVFGNMGEDSGTGVGFTRNPATGEKGIYGEYLLNAQGEDVVAGIRTPRPLSQLKDDMPGIYEELVSVTQRLETHYRDVQDFEFTIENGVLYLLQTRGGKRTVQAAIKIATDMVEEKLITKEEALRRVEPDQLDQLLHRWIDPGAKVEVITQGLPASPGAATGAIVFTADRAVELAKDGGKVILVRSETSPEDIHGMAAAEAILTSRGGVTSHAAVVARGMGKCCVVGCETIKVDEKKGKFEVNGFVFREGDFITLDGSTGKVIKGIVPTVEPVLSDEFRKLMKWADEVRVLGVRANADTPKDARIARELGAEGIGLCRTEHMFFGEDRLPYVQKMILAEDHQEREKALKILGPIQKEDFKNIFKEMEGLPVIIRLLDPPLHEFLPNYEDLLLEVDKLKLEGADEEVIQEKEKLLHRVEGLREVNPMLGHRGCRLGITFPEVYKMQTRAAFEAAAELVSQKRKIYPEIMIPLVVHEKELSILRKEIIEVINEVMKEKGVDFEYKIGTMIELPRAALCADKIAREADFFSFGTNDLTQTTFGFSRDDAEGKFLPIYLKNKILNDNPFQVMDQEGVGELVRIGTRKGRQTKENLEIGICGEHGGETSSVKFCHRVGMDYVSCSPYRVPIARLAAAQAVLEEEEAEP